MYLIGRDLFADEGKWLYQEIDEQRDFWKSLTLAKAENKKYYSECTNEEKEQWEEEHKPQPEPEPSPEPSED